MRTIKITPAITRRGERSLDHYLNEIAKYTVLTAEEEYHLFVQRSVDTDLVLDKIVKHNLRFVVSVAKKYQDCGLPLVSLINEGNLGLIKAAERFDHTRGFKFISYAVWWIRQSILGALNEKSRKIRTPIIVWSLGNKITRFKSDFLQLNEREPEVFEIAEALDLTTSRVDEAIKSIKSCTSIDAQLSEDSQSTMANLLVDSSIASPDADLVAQGENHELEHLLDLLSPKQAYVLRSYYGINREFPTSLSEIADDLDVSRERVRQIRDQSIRKLRAFYRQSRLDMSLT